MNHQRMTALLVGHALAEETPLGPMLRAQGAPGAAAAAESGDLDGCLQAISLAPDLRGLAGLWPAALRPAQQRLSAFPSPRIFQLPTLQVLSYIVIVGMVQAGALVLLLNRILPTFLAIGIPPSTSEVLSWAPVLLFLLAAVFPAAVWWSQQRGWWGWRRHYRRARQAALAAAMVEAGAPDEAQRALRERLSELGEVGADVRELEQLTVRALAMAEQAHQRAVSAIRLVGVGGLLLVAGTVTVTVYRMLAGLAGVG